MQTLSLGDSLREVVRRVELGHPHLVVEMRDLLATNIESLDNDQRLLELLEASIDSNVSTIFHMMANEIDLHSIKPPTAAMEYAARLAQRDIPLSALTRAYYLAQSLMIRISLEEVEGLELPQANRLELVRAVADTIHGYIDWMLQKIADEYGTEHRRWWSARAMTNTATILKVLRGEGVSSQTFRAETSYELEQQHLALVAWLDDPAGAPESQQRLDRLVRQVAALLGSTRAPLISAIDRSTVWAWASMPVSEVPPKTRQALDEVIAGADGVRLALGAIGAGLDGFRRSHEQAENARQVALVSPKFHSCQVVAESDPGVSLASLLFKDQLASVQWMNRVLGPFVDGGEHNAAVRQTLGVFYSSGQNYSRTAELLSVHRNTVRHRIAKFEESVGGSAHVDALEVALALRMHDLLESRTPKTVNVYN